MTRVINKTGWYCIAILACVSTQKGHYLQSIWATLNDLIHCVDQRKATFPFFLSYTCQYLPGELLAFLKLY